MSNLRLAFRALIKTPIVSIVALLSLALGIGANAAIFSLYEQMLLRPVPVSEPDRLVNLLSPGPKPGSQSTSSIGDMDSVFSYPMYQDLQAAAAAGGVADRAFTGVAAHRNFAVNLAFEGSTVSAAGLLVSGNYFSVLGLQPATGRLISPEDDREIGAHSVVVLSHAYWQSAFASDPSVVGKTLVVNGHPMEIIGVAPQGYSGTTLGFRPRIYVPISMRGVLEVYFDAFEERRSYWVYLFGRLESGQTLEGALAALNPVYQNQIRQVEVELQAGMSPKTLEMFAAKQLALEPGRRGQSGIHSEVTTPLLVLLGATGLVLLIAAANLANLFLVRASDRAGEIAIRMSIGARRMHVVLQMLTESFVLAVLGAGLGLVVAQGTLAAIGSMLPSDDMTFSLSLGGTLWLFLGFLVAVTGLVGLFPALHASRKELISSLRGQSGRTSSSRGSARFRTSMVTLQIAFSVALLAAAGLFIKSLVNISRVELGLDVDQLVTFGVSPQLNGYTNAESLTFFKRLEEELSALPGVESATASLVPLVADSNWGNSVTVQGYPSGPDVDQHSNFSEVGPGFFKTVGIELLAGREFDQRDEQGAPKVAIVNEAFAKKFGLGRQAVGKLMSQSTGNAAELDIQIVGLVRDATYSEVKGEVPPLFYRPYRQEERGRLSFYLRTGVAPESLLGSVRGAVARLDPNLPVEGLRTMQMQVEENVFLDRLLGSLSTAFAVLATLLASIGLYGVLAYSVAQRKKEIGLRMALGADQAKVRSLVLGQVAWMTLAGSLLGLLGALAIGRVAGALLFELDGHDPQVLTAAMAVIATVSLIAGFLPAQRAAKVDPMWALRDE